MLTHLPFKPPIVFFWNDQYSLPGNYLDLSAPFTTHFTTQNQKGGSVDHPSTTGLPPHLQGSLQIGQLHGLPGDLLLGHRVQRFGRPLVEPPKRGVLWAVNVELWHWSPPELVGKCWKHNEVWTAHVRNWNSTQDTWETSSPYAGTQANQWYSSWPMMGRILRLPPRGKAWWISWHEKTQSGGRSNVAAWQASPHHGGFWLGKSSN